MTHVTHLYDVTHVTHVTRVARVAYAHLGRDEDVTYVTHLGRDEDEDGALRRKVREALREPGPLIVVTREHLDHLRP